ncbi:MAG: methylmalonyl-CoA mutase family protein [bacterium]|nr:methylmalonyl-CoA mutase family protein [bacterium]
MSESYFAARTQWQASAKKMKDRGGFYRTVSSEPISLLGLPETYSNRNLETDIGFPGQYPYTRGIHPNMYRGKLWTMRQFAGFGTPEETNERYHYLLNNGQTGLSVAFDLPTLMGRDGDDKWAKGEVGKCGVAVSSLRDMDVLMRGIDQGAVTTSMTINSPSFILWAFYIAAGEKKGTPRAKMGGTLQNDILKEFIAQKEFIFPVRPSVKLVVDTIEFATKEMPLWNSVSISGYHIREAGSTAAQELAFTLADGFAYIEATLERGLDIDDFAPRLSHFFNSHIDFFEEVAKFRAARRIYARIMREKYGAKKERSCMLRFHTQTAGCSLTAQQPENNIVRTAYEALAAVFGGTQSLHTNSMDETLALPSEKAVKIALRTQQIIAQEIGVAHTIDPLGGSWFVEELTDKIEAEALEYFRKIEEIGGNKGFLPGVIAGIDNGFFQREIANAAYLHQQEFDRKDRIIVGVNDYIEQDEKVEIPILQISEGAEQRQCDILKQIRRDRNNVQADECIARLKGACEEGKNVMPYVIDCANAMVTLGEMVEVMKTVYGEYIETSVF